MCYCPCEDLMNVYEYVPFSSAVPVDLTVSTKGDYNQSLFKNTSNSTRKCFNKS